jgi:hypothetical protein
MMPIEPETALLVNDLASFARRFVVMTDEQQIAFALWVLHTHAIEAAEATPYLAVTSAEKQSGKTLLAVEVAGALVANPVPTANASVAAVFRAIPETGRVTLLIDEMDAVWSGRSERTEELRGILNAGHRRGQTALRCVGEGSRQKVQRFPVFCPKTLVGIGAMPDTIADRSIPIRLKRRARDEQVERARLSKITREGAPLRRRAQEWAERAVPVLTEMEPHLPDELSDRAQDGAEPLLAIADLAEDEWPTTAREALIALHAEQHADAPESKTIKLLIAAREVFDSQAHTRIFSADLIAGLAADEAGPWGSYNGPDRAITPHQLSKLLAAHDISPHTVRVGSETKKGYAREQFEDAWARHLPALAQNADTTGTPDTNVGFAEGSQLELDGTQPARVGNVSDTVAVVPGGGGSETPVSMGDVSDVPDVSAPGTGQRAAGVAGFSSNGASAEEEWLF